MLQNVTHKIADLLLSGIISTLYLSRKFTIKIAEFKSMHISCKIRSSQSCYWGFRPPGIWQCVTGRVVPDILKECITFIIVGQEVSGSRTSSSLKMTLYFLYDEPFLRRLIVFNFSFVWNKGYSWLD